VDAGPDGPDADAIGQATAIDSTPAYASPFVDLPGDPMRLYFERADGAENIQTMPRPAGVPAERAGSTLTLLRDEMISREQRLITTLPSSREDFAFFQAQRTAAAVTGAPDPVLVQTGQQAEKLVTVAPGEEASWGETLDLDGTGTTAPITYTTTRVENITSTVLMLAEAQRRPLYEDIILELKDARQLARLMEYHGANPAGADAFAAEAAVLIPESATLDVGQVLAFRLIWEAGRRVPVQLALYESKSSNSVLGAVARGSDNRLVLAADPWIEDELFDFVATDATEQTDTSREYRLLDAFYSAATRNGVPATVVGETIVMMSQAFDMEAFASPGDSMALLYAAAPGTGEPGPGQVLYAAIKGEGKTLECHVFRPEGATAFSCFNASGASAGAGGVRLRAGMTVPVAGGTLTSRFGPRMHPKLGKMLLHKGVDWAAATGTPIMAAFDGEVVFAGDGSGYGNLVRIAHPDGSETRYAHMSRFDPVTKVGVSVRAGTVIGYVGTTGLSTGPHLHFELYVNADPVDPLSAGSTTTVMADSDGSAVETLTDQIIRVESGGRADAKNPLSSATGLGQFIDGTWLRMMQTYRPDLAGTLPRDQQLALRFDPTISREMVQNLAREGEAYLRARGHAISAGRLYLCHFLGMEGANKLLSADPGASAEVILGAGVAKANPTIIIGQTAAQVEAWAERKMNRKGGGGVTVVIPPEVTAYQDVIAALIKMPI
jgi:murein DD-endopeptidase MepM/ murein hydrolase activator NlpD